MTKKTILVVVLAATLLGACGGGGNDEETGATTSTAPRAATTLAPTSSTTSGSSPTTTGASSSPTSTTATTGPGGAKLTAASTLDLRGLGPVRVGMTPAEATAAAGLPIVAPQNPECAYAKAEGGPDGVLFMVVAGRIVRVDVRAGSPIKTLSGVGLGDTETQVQSLYANRLEVTPHEYVTGGHYLTLVPTDASDSGYRLIFETDGSKVTTFRSGKLPEAAFVEGCS